jgi:hypothetical protein
MIGDGDEGAQHVQPIHDYPDLRMSEVSKEWIITARPKEHLP